MNQPDRARVAARLEQVERAGGIDLEVRLRCEVTVGDADQRGEMEDGGASLEKRPQAARILHVPRDDLQVRIARPRVEMADAAKAIVMDERADAVAAPEKQFHQVAADESAGAGDGNEWVGGRVVHGGIIHKRMEHRQHLLRRLKRGDTEDAETNLTTKA